MNVLFYDEVGEIGKSKSARTVYIALGRLHRLAGLSRIGPGVARYTSSGSSNLVSNLVNSYALIK